MNGSKLAFYGMEMESNVSIEFQGLFIKTSFLCKFRTKIALFYILKMV